MQAQDLIHAATTRHTCKAFDPARRIDDATIDALRTLLRYAPSSVNSQPWHFLVAASDAGKQRIADALQGNYTYNAAKVLNASHVVVLCTRHELDDAHLAAVLTQEAADGRLKDDAAKATQDGTRKHYANLHRQELQDLRSWMEKQTYIALGTLLQGAGLLGIDACPMEGFDPVTMNAALGLDERKLGATVLVALGYRSDADFNAKLPKSRLPEAALFTEL